MDGKQADVVVAGHICIDVIPSFGERYIPFDQLLQPGKLVSVGTAITATGGPVSNTGLALHRLGVPTRLMGKVGSDLFGNAILDLLRGYDEDLARGMIVEPGESSSYTIVISPPGVDRLFLHSPGANHTFRAGDVDLTRLAGARIFHFGYPPLMRCMYADDGAELASLMQRVKQAGLTTSLDMAYPDPDSEAGQVNWVKVLERTLPHVDLYIPSLDETLFMLDRPRFDAISGGSEADLFAQVDGDLLGKIGERLLGMGAAVAALKLGNQGLYMRTTTDPARLQAMGACAPPDPAAWLGREMLTPCFRANLVGTTGSGDSTIAGFLTGLLKGLPPEDVMTGAVAVGGFNVEAADATSGIRDWETVQARVRAGWDRLPVHIALPGWEWRVDPGLWVGPRDASRR